MLLRVLLTFSPTSCRSTPLTAFCRRAWLCVGCLRDAHQHCLGHIARHTYLHLRGFCYSPVCICVGFDTALFAFSHPYLLAYVNMYTQMHTYSHTHNHIIHTCTDTTVYTSIHIITLFHLFYICVTTIILITQIGSNQGCDDKFSDMSAFAWHGYDRTDLYFAVTARPAAPARLSDHYLCERDHWGRPTVALLHVHPHAVNRAAEDEAAAELLYKLLLHEVG